MSEITFEHELARSEAILPYMVLTFKNLHPEKGKELESQLTELRSPDEKANLFISYFIKTNVLKGQFAQELANILDKTTLKPDAIPQYIQNALRHLGVID
jgi:FAD synthase